MYKYYAFCFLAVILFTQLFLYICYILPITLVLFLNDHGRWCRLMRCPTMLHVYAPRRQFPVVFSGPIGARPVKSRLLIPACVARRAFLMISCVSQPT